MTVIPLRKVIKNILGSSVLAGILACATPNQAPPAQVARLFSPVAVYQGPEGSDAFSSIHALGDGRVLAGKRRSNADNRFLLSLDEGATWNVVGCPGSTGAHTYFIGQNGATLLSGTGDAGAACIMRSVDSGSSWSVGLSNPQLELLIGSADARSVFGVVHLGLGHWLANIKSFDTRVKVIESFDDGSTWSVPSAQPGQNASSWARQMILTSDGILLWPSCLTDSIYSSTDRGRSWTRSVIPTAQLFQPLCDAGSGVYICGEAGIQPCSPIRLFRSDDHGLTWTTVVEINLQRSSFTYWRDVIRAGPVLLASACCAEDTSDEREMQLFESRDVGKSWSSLGNPYIGPNGGMQAIYQMCVTDAFNVFAACQPDSTILCWPVPPASE